MQLHFQIMIPFYFLLLYSFIVYVVRVHLNKSRTKSGTLGWSIGVLFIIDFFFPFGVREGVV